MPDHDVPNSRAAWDVPKQRRCLRCRETFASEWSGERICRRCKKTKAWLADTPYQGGAFPSAGGTRK